MQLRPITQISRSFTGGRTPPPWVRVRSSAVGLAADFLPSRRGLGQIVIQGEALVPGEVTAHLAGHGTLVVPVIQGDDASQVALELAARILGETSYDACVRTRGDGFSIALGVKAEVV